LTRDDVTDVPAEFVADPFLLSSAGGWHMFFEVMNWRTGKGEIGHATSPAGHRWHYQRIVLSESFHLSYPHVFTWDGDVYMIPESFQAESVRLYRARSFPDRWEFVTVLIEGAYLVDASAFRYHDRWWMFVDASPDRGHNLLRLFGADELTGPWREHPASPIVAADPRSARPAGRVLVTADGPVRFAQNCAPAYGTDVRAFIIEELTPAAYRERPAAGDPLFGPAGRGWNAAGMHHVDAHPAADGWLAAVDGWRMPDPLEEHFQ
jgi:hypothetical protein